MRHYNHTLAINNQGSVMGYRQNYLDLDPTYRDRYGRPLMRMTFDFQQNEQKQANFIADVCVKIGQAMGGGSVVRRGSPQRYSIVPYQSTHNTGGAVMGTDPTKSALNTCRSGTYRTCSSPALACSHRTPARNRPAL